MGARIARRTLALVPIVQIDARTAVQARIIDALVHIVFARFAGKAELTRTLVSVVGVGTFAAISARRWFTFVSLYVTHSATVAHRTIAHVSIGCVRTGSMGTGFFGARHRLLFAVFAHPAGSAFAAIIVVVRLVNAFGTVQTWADRAIAHLCFTFVTHVAGRTFACVRSVAGVKASASILARPMVGAVVQVLVTE